MILDLSYSPQQFEVISIDDGDIFTLFAQPHVAIDRGIIHRLGGATMDPRIGVGGWVRVTVVELAALTNVEWPMVTIRPSAIEAVSRRGQGLVPDAWIEIVPNERNVRNRSSR